MKAGGQQVTATEEAQSSEAWFCASVQPQKQDRVKLHPCNSAQHLRKRGPPGFLRVFFAATLSLLLPVRYAFGAIACNVKHEQSTSELPRLRHARTQNVGRRRGFRASAE